MGPEVPFIMAASLFTIGAVTWLLTPIVRGLGERLKAGRAGDAQLNALRAEVQALRDDLLDEQQRLRTELSELTERLDFTERLLAQQRHAAGLPPP
jgi:hypothetical protein